MLVDLTNCGYKYSNYYLCFHRFREGNVKIYAFMGAMDHATEVPMRRKWEQRTTTITVMNICIELYLRKV
jgi:hypothetical protein